MEVLISSSRGDTTRPAFGTGASLARAVVLLTTLALLTACQPAEESQPIAEPIRPVRVVMAEELPGGETVTLTGNVQAQDDVSLAFRVGGQLVERTVTVGDEVRAGQVVARLDGINERHAVDAARANLAAA
ncbi:biotin/lipoyl-binding protein, partial [Thiocapsa sp.]|uniref:biotin/lipoyl-binding protein n=1 Tax=Thiocapsa sp. TaxID=2024551 RepID=UPI003593B314